MSRSTHLWIMRTLWILAVLCFVVGIVDGSPVLKKAGLPLFFAYVVVAVRLHKPWPVERRV
jgi:hypothetical protein